MQPQLRFLAGPADLYRVVAWLCEAREAPLEEAAPVLRAIVDQPLETLELAERLGLVVQSGLALMPTPLGCAWAARPEVRPPTFEGLLGELPLETVRARLRRAGGRLSLVALADLVTGPHAEQTAQALADWGEWLGYWQQEAGWLWLREAA
ncbi:hypothetical protein [Meiothermus sp. CFH 77666]|uniref:hypothetical protein n=1 Tax=Meiothermus sp. CFH 77666 TaxID=2817942 RepID=UPI001AA08B80|nr:hypothetical protein [Meiothermus sp. CFH 77666]MBO1437990.1 hypothetical protein [Meiothermus sp. CFH 77666]